MPRLINEPHASKDPPPPPPAARVSYIGSKLSVHPARGWTHEVPSCQAVLRGSGGVLVAARLQLHPSARQLGCRVVEVEAEHLHGGAQRRPLLPAAPRWPPPPTNARLCERKWPPSGATVSHLQAAMGLRGCTPVGAGTQAGADGMFLRMVSNKPPCCLCKTSWPMIEQVMGASLHSPSSMPS